MDWQAHADEVAPHVVRIATPDKSGTGFLVRNREDVIQIATAAHVVRDARTWGQQITIHESFPTGKVFKVSADPGLEPNAAMTLHGELDSAILTLGPGDIKGNALPKEPIELVPPGHTVKLGVEIAWLGYPDLVPGYPLCFFSGHVSAVVDHRYFIDGIAIPGVSGGPAFFYKHTNPKGLRILGSITAYAQRGQTLPGLMVADNVSWAHGLR